MRRALMIAVAVLVFLFVLVTFLNCGHEASAMTDRERVRRNKVTSSTLVVSHQQIRVPAQAQGATDCERVQGQFVFENALGNRLFSYTLVGRWCFDGTDVVWHAWSPAQHHIGHYWWSNWEFEGDSPPVDTGGNGMHYVFRRVQGTFGVHILWFHKVVTPTVQCTLRGDGTSRCGEGL